MLSEKRLPIYQFPHAVLPKSECWYLWSCPNWNPDTDCFIAVVTVHGLKCYTCMPYKVGKYKDITVYPPCMTDGTFGNSTECTKGSLSCKHNSYQNSKFSFYSGLLRCEVFCIFLYVSLFVKIIMIMWRYPYNKNKLQQLHSSSSAHCTYVYFQQPIAVKLRLWIAEIVPSCLPRMNAKKKWYMEEK